MTFEELQALIAQGEGQRLDFKRGVPSVKDLTLTVICLANADGGKILLGVDDRGRICGCLSYDVPELRHGRRCLPAAGGQTVSAHVPGRRAGLSIRANRIGLQRAASGQARYPDDVDPQALERLRAEIALRSPALAQQTDRDLLRNLQLLVDGEEPARLTVAGGLLLGRADILRRDLAQAEVAYFRQRTDTDIRLSERLYLPLPLLLRRLEELIEADNEVHSFLLGLQRIDVSSRNPSIAKPS